MMMLNMKPSKQGQDKYVKKNNTCKGSLSFPGKSTVAVLHEDVGPWMNGVIKEANSIDYRRRSYIIRVMKMGRLVI